MTYTLSDVGKTLKLQHETIGFDRLMNELWDCLASREAFERFTQEWFSQRLAHIFRFCSEIDN